MTAEALTERLRVTVVGVRRQVDLAVPAHAAIAEYSARLLDLCGTEPDEGALPAVWSLAAAGVRPYPPSHSLVQSGVAEGTVLYLRDYAAGELDDPLVTDIVELVDAASKSRRAWDARLAAATMLVSGLVALAAGLAAFAAVAHPPVALAAAALAGGVVAALLARRAAARAWPLPGPALLALALTPVPLFALAPVFLAPIRTNGATIVIGVVCGAVAGAVTARAVLPRLVTTVTVALTLIVLPVPVGLALAGTGVASSSAVVALLALGLLEFAPAVSGHLVASTESADSPVFASPAAEVDSRVRQGRLVLCVITVFCCAVLTACVVLLAGSHDAYAVALAVTLGLTLLLRSARLTVLPARLSVVVAGAGGLTAVVLLAGAGPARAAGLPPPLATGVGPLLVAAVGVGLAGAGLAKAFRAADETAADDPGDEPPGWIGALATLFTTACVPLTLGVFGVFELLFNAGGRM